MKNPKYMRVVSLLLFLSLVLAACQPEKIVETVVVTEVVEKEGKTEIVEKVVVVTPTPEPEPTPVPDFVASPFNRAEAVRMAILSDIDGMNPWYLFDTPGSSYWNYVLTSAYYPTLYALSDQRWDWVPSLADGFPEDIVQEGEFYVGTVKLKKDLKWSDGSPLTAADMAFTANTVLAFALAGNWVGYFNPAVLDRVEAVDDLTLKFYYSVVPGLPIWQYGALLGVIVSKAYWEPKVADLLEQALALDPAAPDYLDLITPLQQELEALPVDGEPTFGGMKFNKWEAGAYAENIFNDQYPFLGLVEELYANGAFREFDDAGYEFKAFGEPSGEKVLELTYGPYFDSFIFPVYSQDAAYLALQSGEVDMVLNPTGLSKGLRTQLSQDPNLEIVRNAQNGFRYIEFNMARPHFGGEQGMALRQAVACMIDHNLLVTNVLQGEVDPVYTLVPEGLTFWFNKDVPVYCKDMNEGQRLTEAVRILKEAGFTWDVEPVYIEDPNPRNSGAQYGEGIKLPDGSYVPELDFQAPGPGYDPLRATIAVHIEQWLKELGIPVLMNYTPFNTIRANENAGTFDIIMLGWGLTSFPSYLCDFFTGATGVADGSDNLGYVSPKLNQQCAAFYSETDLEAARQIAYDMQVTLATELPYITLYTNPIYDALSQTIVYPYTKVFDGLQGLYSGWNLVMPAGKQ